MAGKELDIVAIISPKIGKVDRVSWSPSLGFSGATCSRD